MSPKQDFFFKMNAKCKTGIFFQNECKTGIFFKINRAFFSKLMKNRDFDPQNMNFDTQNGIVFLRETGIYFKLGKGGLGILDIFKKNIHPWFLHCEMVMYKEK